MDTVTLRKLEGDMLPSPEKEKGFDCYPLALIHSLKNTHAFLFFLLWVGKPTALKFSLKASYMLVWKSGNRCQSLIFHVCRRKSQNLIMVANKTEYRILIDTADHVAPLNIAVWSFELKLYFHTFWH